MAAGDRSQAATREVGYANPHGDGSAGAGVWWSGTVAQSEETPELQWPRSVTVYDRMRKQDTKVKSSLRAVKSPLLATTWRIDPGSASTEVVEFVARNLNLPIKGVSDSDQTQNKLRGRDRFSFASHLREVLRFLEFGHAVFEQLYRYDEATGRLLLRKLAHRPQASISKWNVARDGGLNSVEQYAPDGAAGAAAGRDVTLPISRLVVYSHEREDAAWWGESILRSAYKNWILKDRLLRVDTTAVERNGMGVPVHITGDRGPDVSPDEYDEYIKAGLDIARGLRAGDNAGAALGPGDDLKLLTAGTLPDALRRVLYHDDQIGSAVLAHVLNLGRQTGSWALGRTFQDILVSSLNQIGDAICDVVDHHVIEDLVDLNFGPDEPAPRLVYEDLSGQDQALAYAIKALVDAGAITPDAALETYLRSQYRMPQPEPDTAQQTDDEETP